MRPARSALATVLGLVDGKGIAGVAPDAKILR